MAAGGCRAQLWFSRKETSMVSRTMRVAAVACTALLLSTAWLSHARQGQPAAPMLYNTAKQKLLQGKSIVGGTVASPDPNIYCAMAGAGFDYLWIEMQHSPLTYSD